MMNVRGPIVAFALALVLVGACTSGSETTTVHDATSIAGSIAPPQTEMITAFGWSTGWCGHAFRCEAAASIAGSTITVTSASHQGARTVAQLNDRGLRGLSGLGRDILDTNPRRVSGLVALDGVYYSLTIEQPGWGPWSGTWGYEGGGSPFRVAFDRTQLLVDHMVRCEADPWLDAAQTCTPIVHQ